MDAEKLDQTDKLIFLSMFCKIRQSSGHLVSNFLHMGCYFISHNFLDVHLYFRILGFISGGQIKILHLYQCVLYNFQWASINHSVKCTPYFKILYSNRLAFRAKLQMLHSVFMMPVGLDFIYMLVCNLLVYTHVASLSILTIRDIKEEISNVIVISLER